MPKIVGVRFKKASQIYYFDPADMQFEHGEDVVVETARGLALGKVAVTPTEAAAEELSEPLKSVVRRAQPDDFERLKEMKEKENNALAKCEELVAKFQLAMSPLAAEYNLDGTHLTVFFKAEKRVDFRALLRELSNTLKTRVELRQVGARDAAKLVGGMGRCGFHLCCASHLCKFEPISMKMAREQDLPLNPTNISGVCGRLLCCLSYENDQYREMKQKMPAPGKNVSTRVGDAKVIGCNPLKETVIVQLESEATLELPLSEIELPENDRPQPAPSPSE
jgi:cell fate regulator YaaT (PSP1 superfamily)